MADIKTKDVIKGTIKTLDRAAIATDRVKHAYVSTKDKAEKTVHTEESSGAEYASNKASSSVSITTRKGIQTFDKVGRESTKTTIENVQKSAEFTKEKVAKAKQGMDSLKMKRAEQSLKKQTGRATSRSTSQTIRTAKEVEKGVKQSVTSAGNKNIKRGLKATAKTSSRYLKTAEQTSKTAIKTTEHTAKMATFLVAIYYI